MVLRSGRRQSTSLNTVRAWRILGLYALVATLVWLGGCRHTQTTVPDLPTVQPTSTPAITPGATGTPIASSPTVDPNAPITLTIWLPPEMATSANTDGQAINTLNRVFSEAYPRTQLEIITKAAYGPGGLTNMLLTTAPVVPARMPDLVAVDADELPQLVEAGIVAPLDQLLPGSVFSATYPFAESLVDLDGLMAVPFQADVMFLAYNNTMVKTVPQLWDDLVRTESTLLFPAGSGDGSAADFFVLQYLARGGSLTENDGSPYLNISTAAQVLNDYLDAVEEQRVPSTVRGMGTLEDCWNIYLTGEAGMTATSYSLYASTLSRLTRTRYAPLPPRAAKR